MKTIFAHRSSNLFFLNFFLLLVFSQNTVYAINQSKPTLEVVKSENAELQTVSEAIAESKPQKKSITRSEKLQRHTETAKLELIHRLDLNLAANSKQAISQINIVSSQWVTWLNRSLGCPKDGEQYPEVLTPGYLIILEYNSIRYQYHGSENTILKFCQHPQTINPIAPSHDPR